MSPSSFFALSLFKKFVLRDIRRNALRTVLTVCGIALGVAVFLAISIANDTALSRFRETVSQVAGKANLEILPTGGVSMDESVLGDLEFLRLSDVKWTPLVDEHIALAPTKKIENEQGKIPKPSKLLVESEAEDELIQIVGVDMLCDSNFKHYENKSGAGKDNSIDSGVFEPDSVLIGGALAERRGLKSGDTFGVLTAGGERQLKVAGVMSKEGLGGAYSGNLIVADIPLAQSLTGLDGRISRIDMIVPQDDPALYKNVMERLSATLPGDVTLGSPDTRSEQARKMTRSFEYNLLALTLIALMVGMFLIYNTMTITVLRRRPEIGVLRAIGVKSSTILNMFLWEAVFLGGLGTACGVALGGLLARGALEAVAKTFQHFYFKVPLDNVSPAPEQYILAGCIGMGLTLIAALPPLIESTTVAPSEATRRASFENKLRRFTGALFACGCLCLGACYWSSLQGPVMDFPFFGYLAALLSIIGASLMMPFALSFVLPVLTRTLPKVFGAKGRVAASSLYGTLARTSVAAASLMIGVAMMVSLAIMISSFRKTVTEWIDQSFQADLWMQSQARAAGDKNAKLPESYIPTIAAVPGVAAVEGFVDRRIVYKGLPVFLGAADFDVLAKYGNQLFLSGESNEAVCNRLKGKRAIISEPFAVRRNLHKGDSIELDVPAGATESVSNANSESTEASKEAGKETFIIEDVFYDYASDLGYIIIPRETFKDIYKDTTISNYAIYLDPKADLDSVRAEILSKISGRIAINSTRELRKQAITIFDRTFAITYALHTIAVIVSILSVMNALFALTIESRREFAILRYLGAGKKELSLIVYLQASILALVGNTGGIGLGYILSLLLTHVINKQSFGWSVQYSIPYDFLLQSSLLVLITAVASAAIPARIAARTLAPSVIRDE